MDTKDREAREAYTKLLYEGITASGVHISGHVGNGDMCSSCVLLQVCDAQLKDACNYFEKNNMGYGKDCIFKAGYAYNVKKAKEAVVLAYNIGRMHE